VLRKYLGSAIIAALPVAWTVALAYGWLHFNTAVKMAQGVARGTRTFRQELERPRMDLVTERAFPQGCVVDAVKSAWSEGIGLSAYPSDIVTPPAAPSERTRSR